MFYVHEVRNSLRASNFRTPARPAGFENFRLWSIGGSGGLLRPCPVYPRKQTKRKGRQCPLGANGLNRSRGRALRHGRASNGWNDGSVLPDDEGQKWIIGQHDDRFYHRRRWERSEGSETTSASRIEYPNRCDWRRSHDRERCIRRVRNNSVGRCHVEIFVRPMRYKGCQQAHNAQVVICALFTTRNSLKLQGGERCFHPLAKFVPYRKGCAHNQARQPSNLHSV